MAALREATGWQAHSVRGFLSGKLSKQLGLTIQSLRKDGERVYALQPAAERGAGEQPERNRSDGKRKTLCELTGQEREALSKIETGYVRRDEEGNLLIVDDTNYFRHMREEAEAVKRGTDAELRELPE